MSGAFSVKTESFEGPIDVLLDLIERRKLNINDLSLAEVADDFMEYLKQKNELPIGETAQFLLVASTLLLIKSLSLLPTLEVTEEERESIDELTRRLELYKIIRAQSAVIKEKLSGPQRFFTEQAPLRPVIFSPTSDLTREGVIESMQEVLAHLPVLEKIKEVVVKKMISLETVIQELANRIEKNLRLSFNQFADRPRAERATIIVSFLAMLELVKQGIIRVSQETPFTDIAIETEHAATVPNYTSNA